jgi:hypothetical protein
VGLSVAQSLLGSLGRRSLGDSTSDDVPLFDAYEFADDSSFFGDGLGRLVSGTWENGAVVILSTMLVLEFVYASNAKQITKMIITGIMDFPKSFESAVLTCLNII